jgi:hypothetical protein
VKDPFRDDEDAARLLAAAQAEEGCEAAEARLRKEREKPVEPLRAAPALVSREPSAALRVFGVLIVLVIIVWRVASSCHRVTPAEVSRRTAVVTRTARVTTSEGTLPFRDTSCDLVVAGAVQLFPNCRITLRCGNKVLFRNVNDMEVCRLNDAGLPTALYENDTFMFDLVRGTARLRGTTASRPYSVSFTLE